MMKSFAFAVLYSRLKIFFTDWMHAKSISPFFQNLFFIRCVVDSIVENNTSACICYFSGPEYKLAENRG